MVYINIKTHEHTHMHTHARAHTHTHTHMDIFHKFIDTCRYIMYVHMIYFKIIFCVIVI